MSFISLSVLLGVAAIIGVVKYFNYKRDVLDRMSMNPDGFKLPDEGRKSNDALRFGLLFIGIAAGFLLGSILLKYTIFSEPMFAYLTGIFLCGGIMLIIGYLIENGGNNSNNNYHYPKQDNRKEQEL